MWREAVRGCRHTPGSGSSPHVPGAAVPVHDDHSAAPRLTFEFFKLLSSLSLTFRVMWLLLES